MFNKKVTVLIHPTYDTGKKFKYAPKRAGKKKKDIVPKTSTPPHTL